MNTMKHTVLPTSPGVYLFKDMHGIVIYIGKAKNLRYRVRSYFKKKNLSAKNEAISAAYHDLDFITTETELSACLLEADLIQKYKPSFNVTWKEGQPFIYLLFTDEEVPRLKIVRNKTEKGFYFGPFIHKSPARSVHQFLVTTFALGLCNKKLEYGCLNYHIGICPGSCKSDFSRDDYLFRLNLAKHVLQQHNSAFSTSLEDRIKIHNRAFEFEKAKQLSTYLKNMDFIFRAIHERYSSKKFDVEVFIATTPLSPTLQASTHIADELKKLLGTAMPVHTIDCFDISHFQGRYTVGSCIRFTDGKPDKNHFRRFRIRTAPAHNDYAALQEIVIRRYKNNTQLPNLILIDGGKGQLSAVQTIISHVPIASLAKREERLFSVNHTEGILLDVKTNLGKLLISLRDYTHHFAIKYHRLKRHKQENQDTAHDKCE